MALLDGKTAIVTGAGRGLGRVYAIALAAEGARVLVNDIDAAEAEAVVEEITRAGGRAAASTDSVAGWDSARRIVQQCGKVFGPVDTLVNNAGVMRLTPVWQITEQEIDQALAVNLKGAMCLSRHALDVMLPRRAGCIINVTSGAQAGLLHRTTYGATKAALAGLTYAMALDLAPHNIRVNAISPVGQTRMAQATIEAGLSDRPSWPPELVAPLVVFLASDDASYITGQVVRLAGKFLSLYSHPRSIHPVINNGGWALDDLRRYFKRTLGQRLEPVGQDETRYNFYQGLGTSAATAER